MEIQSDGGFMIETQNHILDLIVLGQGVIKMINSMFTVMVYEIVSV